MNGCIRRCFERNRVSSWKKRVIYCIMVPLVIMGINGCSKKLPPPPQAVFTVKSKADTNEGQPFYVAIRVVSEKQFLTESYQEVVSIIFKDPPDASVLAAKAIVPGQKEKVSIVKPDTNVLGIYCFFTQPGEPWKVKLSQPLDDKYEVVLEDNRIVQTKKKKGLFGRFCFF